jgi:hypothetical protein
LTYVKALQHDYIYTANTREDESPASTVLPLKWQEEIMCCLNYNTKLARLMSKAIVDAAFRERFLADPVRTAREFGFSEADQQELAKYDARKLRAMAEGPDSPS